MNTTTVSLPTMPASTAPATVSRQRAWDLGSLSLVHLLLLGYTALALAPLLLILVNSFKDRSAIFDDPLSLPTADTFSLIGYTKVLEHAQVLGFFSNSLIVTGVSLVLILLLGAMAAWALTEYTFPGRRALALFMAFGIMVPIRLGSVSIMQVVVSLDLMNTLTALVLVYVAQGLPLAIMILSEFIRQVPQDLKDAARCDGVSEYRIFFQVILPLARPGLVAVALFTFLIAWNSYLWALVLTTDASMHVLSVGVANMVGEYRVEWNELMAAAVLAVVPVMLLFSFLEKHLVNAITSGAVKG